ncbi:MAG: polyprenol monophosphomannose synthase [Bacteroidia bacterium]|nr:polyprenol monophosphomannose synthase [Bacteroidia bacterium]
MSNRIVIIPTYNEKENIAEIILKVISLDPVFHILIVDDNSPDGTADIVKSFQSKHSERLHLLQRPGKNGLGTAYIAGFRWCIEKKYDYIFEMDADFSHNPDDLVKLYNACKDDKADVAIGSRYVTGVNVVNWPMSRVIMSYYASAYVRFITGMSIRDATAGFVCYTRKALETFDLDKIKFKGYAFQIEMKFKAWKFGLRLTEVPIIFTDRTLGTSKMSKKIFREAFFGVIELKLKSMFSKPSINKSIN